MGPETLIPLVGIIFGTAIPLVGIIVGGQFLYRWSQHRHEERMKIIESGDPDIMARLTPPRNKLAPIKWACILISFGLALVVGTQVFGTEEATLSLIPLFVGIGLLVYYFGFERRQRDEGEATAEQES